MPLAVKQADHAQQIYDQVAGAYDDLWSKHVTEPNSRLTTELGLRHGDRLVDLACGTGLYTLDMAREVAPAEVVAVDFSEGMLDAGKVHAEAQGITNVTWVHAKAEDYIANAKPESFDAFSMRFALAYIDWKNVLPRVGAMMRSGGRVAILTSTSESIPQAWELYREWMAAFGGAILPSIVPDSVEQVADALAQGGLDAVDTWEYRIRLWFADGMQASRWMRESGYGTHPALEHIDDSALESLMQLFAQGMERYREEKGIPLDLVVAGIIARKA